MSEFKDLPIELALRVLSYCDLATIRSVRAVSADCLALSQEAFVSNAKFPLILDETSINALESFINSGRGKGLRCVVLEDRVVCDLKTPGAIVKGPQNWDDFDDDREKFLEWHDSAEHQAWLRLLRAAKQRLEPTAKVLKQFSSIFNELTHLESIEIRQRPLVAVSDSSTLGFEYCELNKQFESLKGDVLARECEVCYNQHRETAQWPVFQVLGTLFEHHDPTSFPNLAELLLQLSHSDGVDVDQAVRGVTDFLSSCPQLRHLSLATLADQCPVWTQEPAEKILRAAAALPLSTLVSLRIFDDHFMDGDVRDLQDLHKLLEANRTTLETFALQWKQDIHAMVAATIYRLLLTCPKLTTVDISWYYVEEDYNYDHVIRFHDGDRNENGVRAEIEIELERMKAVGLIL